MFSILLILDREIEVDINCLLSFCSPENQCCNLHTERENFDYKKDR